LCLYIEGAKKIIPQSANDSTFVDPISPYFDRYPQFPGGLKAYQKFLNENLKWPSQIDAQGKVIISFIVEKDGRLTNIKVDKKLGAEFDNEALRVIKKMPRWEPAMLKGKSVRCRYTIPINFALSAN
jgi:TonB family protein